MSIAFAVAVEGAGAPPRWFAIGPPGAQTLVAAADPAFPDRVYAATRNDVYVSLDGGPNFSRLGPLPLEESAYGDTFITDIAVLRGPGAESPDEPRLVVQVNPRTNAPSLYVSFDGGRSWNPGVDAETAQPIELTGMDLAAVPGSVNVVFAIGGFSGGNFRTNDGGSTWRAIQLPSVLGQPRFLPVTEDLLVVASDKAGFFRSTDGGVSWVSIAAGLPAPPYSWISLAADAREPTTLWSVIGDTGTFRSKDAGATWTQQGGSFGLATAYPRDLFVDGDTVFSSGGGAFRSRDGGRTWTNLNVSDNPPRYEIIARDANTGRLYFDNMDGGVSPTNLWFSQDDGDTVYPSERGLHGVNTVHIGTDAGGRLYSWAEGRLYRRDSVPDLWQDITPSNSDGCEGSNDGTYGPGPIVVTADGTLLVPGKDYSFEPPKDYICRSMDGGEHWVPVPAGAPRPVNRYWLLAVGPDDPNTMYSRYDTLVGFGGILTATTIYRSFDSGLHWEAVNQPFTITDRLYATGGSKLIALRSGLLAVSPDGGNYWSVSLSVVRDLSVSASRPQIALVATDIGMYRTEDGGGTFVRLGDLPDASITQVALHPNADQVAYAVTDRGHVYLSADGGVTWMALGGTLDPLVELFDVVAAAAAPSTLIAGTTHGVQTIYAASDQRELAEFYHPEFDHYFLSADPDEIYFLRMGGLPPWRPTGRWSWGSEKNAFDSSPVCRFWSGQTFAPKSSHFYTAYQDECQGLQQGSVWLFEGQAFGWRLPTGAPGSRVCPADNWPLYRAYNNGEGGAPNHRYTTDPAVLDAMLAQGWIMEGEASTRVFACVAAQQ